MSFFELGCTDYLTSPSYFFGSRHILENLEETCISLKISVLLFLSVGDDFLLSSPSSLTSSVSFSISTLKFGESILDSWQESDIFPLVKLLDPRTHDDLIVPVPWF